ncbi:hypothetical protein TNCV_1688351 [Trichonephila clavipes]|nr:hypothetical protein TNCV_1688351 [Trichonephila clavipes]
MTPELAPPLLTTTPHQREDVSALDRFNLHRCPTRWVFRGAGLELIQLNIQSINPEPDLTFDDYVLVVTYIAVWGALSDAEIVALDHNNTESDEDE